MKIRLNKCLTFYSRREIDKIIKEERIKVNSFVATLGQRISFGDVITIDNQRINWEEIFQKQNQLPNVRFKTSF